MLLLAVLAVFADFQIFKSIYATTPQKGINVSDAELASLNIEKDTFHPEWNYNITPQN